MKRAAVFAHYDKDSIIDDYVIYYLNALKEVCSKIVFVSCGNLSEEEQQKLSGLADYVIAKPHNEYDFGSYKRGFLYLKNSDLLDYDELVFANDSCYGPFYPFKVIFEEMESKDCDFWGITKNNFGYRKQPNHFFIKRPHVQSYFIAFKKDVFASDFFAEFVESVREENHKNLIVSNYEIGLTEMLVEKGFIYDVYVKGYERINNITILKWRQIIEKCRMPLMKCSLPRLVNKSSTTVEGYQEIIKSVCSYPVELIENNAKRTMKNKYGRHTSPIFIKRAFFDILAEMPFFVRKITALIISRCLPFIRD